MEGWIKLHRCTLEKAVWQLNDAQRIVFITILLLANHRGNEWVWRGQPFSAEPGQFVTSSQSLARTARVSRQSVRTALENLKKQGFLTYESTKTGLLVTIVKWATYQADGKASAKTITKPPPTDNQGSTTNKNEKNDENDKNTKYDYFADFWREYPKKFKKMTAQKAFEALDVDDALMDRIMKGLFRSIDSAEWKEEKGRFVPHPTTWLHQRRWEDGLF